MKSICDYKEFGGNSKKKIIDHISDIPTDYKEEIMEYLLSGTEGEDADRTIFDYVANEQTNLPVICYGDDEFCWDSEIIYHFEKYNMDLSPKFINKLAISDKIPLDILFTMAEKGKIPYAFYKQKPKDKIWWVRTPGIVGRHLFSFDKKRIFNLFRDYPYELTQEEKELFDRENPFWRDLFSNRNKNDKKPE